MKAASFARYACRVRMDVMRIDRLSIYVSRAILRLVFFRRVVTMLVDAVTDRKVVISLERDRPFLTSLPIGSAVAAMAGAVWLTQEGLTTDVILRRGDTFDVVHKGSIVLHALNGPGRVHVTSSTHPIARTVIDAAAFGAAERGAQRLREHEIRRLIGLLKTAFKRVGHTVRDLLNIKREGACRY